MNKNELKKMAFLLVASAIAFSSCEDTPTPPASKEANLLTFGFYAEDNDGALDKDYIIENISDNMTLQLPAEMSKVLVARFTLSDGAKAFVDEVEQESGVTVNDYSIPVELFVSNEGNNRKYTISIGKAPAAVWTEVTNTPNHSFLDYVMKVNPVTGVPYILLNQRLESSSDPNHGKAFVYSYDDGNWASVGGASGVSEGRTTHLDLAFDGEKPIIVFSDYTTTLAQQSTVMAYDGTVFNIVGTKGYTKGAQQFNSISVFKGVPYTFSMNNTVSAGVRRALVISSFEGGTWSSMENIIISRPIPPTADINGVSMGSNSYSPVSMVVKDSLYLAVFNAGSPMQSYSVYKKVGTEWSTLADFAIETGATNTALYSLGMDVDSNGNVYIIIVDNADASVNKARVKRYDSTSKTWSQVGNAISFDFDSSNNPKIALSPSGVPYIVGLDAVTKYLTVVTIDEDTRDWGTPSILLPNPGLSAFGIDFSKSGVGYVTCKENSMLRLFKLASSAN